MPGVVALAPCALAVGIAEQAASRSKAAGHSLRGSDEGDHPFVELSTISVEKLGQCKFCLDGGNLGFAGAKAASPPKPPLQRLRATTARMISFICHSL